MRESWLTPQWRGRRRIDHPVAWAHLPEFDIGVACVQKRVDHGHENRWYLYFRRFNEADIQGVPVLAQTVHTTPIGSTQTTTSPADWNNSNNSIEVIGTGARGAIGASTSTSGGGAGGGAYSKIVNATITTPGTTTYYWRIGATTATNGSVGGDSWWTLTSPGTSFPTTGTAVGAKGGAALASASSATGGAGGALASAYASPATGSVKTSGGNGGTAGASNAAGGGGGGAGGKSGNGVNGSGGPGAGGAGNAGTVNLGGAGGPAGNGAGAAGGAGSNLSTSPTAGSGGGGGGGNASASTGGQGGLYGGGGGGGGRSTGVGGQGRQGVVVLTWSPEVTGTLAATGQPDVSSVAGNVAWFGELEASEDEHYELLLHLDGADASTAIIDSGGLNQTVTAFGTAQIDTAQSVFAGQALMLPAVGDHLSVETGSFAFGTGDFCIDFRARLSSATDPQILFDGGTNGFVISYDGSVLKFISAAGTITGPALAANTNYHIAATRGAGSTRLWKDGVQAGSTLTDATDYDVTSGYPRIGSTAEVAVSGAAHLLLHGDGNLTDAAGRHTIQIVGTAASSATQAKFGSGSIAITSSDVTYFVDNLADVTFTADFTIDCWFYPTSFAGGFDLFNLNSDQLDIFAFAGTPRLYLYSNVAFGLEDTGADLVLNTWQHIALTRASGTFRVFVNGTLVKTFSNSSTLSPNGGALIGRHQASAYTTAGFLDEYRILNGQAIWTAGFTPPTAAYIYEMP